MFGIGQEEKSVSIGMSMKLQGYLIGYSVLQNGVIVKEHKYATPVKNLVLNQGKDYLMRAQNNNTAISYSGSMYSSALKFGFYSGTYYNGVMSYCRRGSGTNAVSASDTNLQTPIGSDTSTFLPGDPNTGTRFDRENGKVIMRATHEHQAESSDVNINELGWLGGIESSKVLFSRIVLPSTITVLTGQSLRTVYQLEVTISPITSTPASPSITGWTTDGDYRWECAFPATSSTFATYTDSEFSLFDTIGTTGASSFTAFNNYGGVEGGGLIPSCSSYTVTMFGSAQSFNSFGTRPGTSAPSSTVFNSGGQSQSASSGTSSLTVQNYTNGNFYRDSTLVCAPNWTGYSSISIYAIRFRGLMYIFDNPQTKTNTQRLTLTYRISVS